MITVPPDEIALEALIGRVVPSDIAPGVSYRVVWRLGEGAMSVVFFALRVTDEGELPVVLKVLRPSFVLRSGQTAELIVKKESIALGRLNERVPHTPFVVRFIDTGTLTVEYKERQVSVPWLVVEYVHGGAEGTTLSERVEHSLRTTGSGFDAPRAAHALDCLADGLVAVHEVGVIHRDLKPDNVLCCGFGEDEIFKIADFGVARPMGIATFSGAVVGTPGFVAPELGMGDTKAVGPWSDIFSLAAVIFYVLTGEEYFNARSPGEAMVLACSTERRSILETRGLSPALRSREYACRSIDFALACGTSVKIESRPHRADALAAMILPWLQVESQRTSFSAKRLEQLREDEDPTQNPKWNWTTMRNPTRGLIVRSVAWDADGHCLAVTSHGLAFWNGASWNQVNFPGLPEPEAMRFVQRIGAGEWRVGAEDATFLILSSEGVTDTQKLPVYDVGVARYANRPPPPEIRFERLNGDFDDLAVVLGTTPAGPPMLCARSSKRWLRPLPLNDVIAVSGIARIEDARWLVTGRATDGGGYAGVYSPLDWEVERLHGATVRAYLSCAGLPDQNTGVMTGADGSVIWYEGGVAASELVEGGYDLSASAIDAVGRGWAASTGRIWMRRIKGASSRGPGGARWDQIWSDTSWPLPIVSLFADLGVVIAMTAEGGLIEGRLLVSSVLEDTDAD